MKISCLTITVTDRILYFYNTSMIPPTGQQCRHIMNHSRYLTTTSTLAVTPTPTPQPSNKPSTNSQQRDNSWWADCLDSHALRTRFGSIWNNYKSKIGIESLGVLLAVTRLWWEEWSKETSANKKILQGSYPKPIPIDPPVDRKDMIDEVVSCFIDKRDVNELTTSFGVILGPTGVGKTCIVKQACCKHPVGVLYFEVVTIGDIAKSLAEVAGMNTEPTLMGALTRYVSKSDSPIGFFKLPEDDVLAVKYVIKEIANRAEKLLRSSKMNRPARLFIDGVDMIAKYDEDLFNQLVDLAKGMANKGSLRIIFVGSEGRILPLLKKTSSLSRCDVMEIPDITENQAVNYLHTKGLPEELAQPVVKVAGPRVLFCCHAVNKYHEIHTKEKVNNEDAFNHIVNFLHMTFVSNAADAFIMGQPWTAQVIQALYESEKAKDQFDPLAFLQETSNEEERAKLKRAIDSLVKADALRYSKDGTLQWNNKLVRSDILQRLKLPY